MKTVIVCGGREYADKARLYEVLDREHAVHSFNEVMQGGCTGADRLAREWAGDRGIPCKTISAQWGKYGRKAGPMRNKEMLKMRPDAVVVCFPGGRGTAHMGADALMRGDGFSCVFVQHLTERSFREGKGSS